MKKNKIDSSRDMGQKSSSASRLGETEALRVNRGLGAVQVAVPSPSALSSKVVPPRPSRPNPTHEQIAERARAIWMQHGCTPGRDQANWHEAEAQLRAELVAG